MQNVCKDQPVEGAINTSKGCAEKINIPAADHQLPCGGELIYCKHGARIMLGLGTRRFNATLNQRRYQAGHALAAPLLNSALPWNSHASSTAQGPT